MITNSLVMLIAIIIIEHNSVPGERVSINSRNGIKSKKQKQSCVIETW